MRNVHFILFIILLVFVYSCKESVSNKITHLVNEWGNKEIIFPSQMYFTSLGKDTINMDSIMNNEFLIVTYIDSIGCTSCKLQLDRWQTFITELDSLTASSVPVLFFLHPKNRKEVLTMLGCRHFDYPICIDENDSLNILNHFPQEMPFQTFLLDHNSKVIAIGNPILNSRVKDLYFDILLGESKVKRNEIQETKIAISEQMINMGNFSWKEKRENRVVLKNIGKFPLVIDEISTSCGCVDIIYNKRPILPKDSTCVKIRYQAEHPGYFDKTITMYCNAKGAPLRLKIIGNAE
ncbi:DUF1573 domain-containing protein [Bacteroides congonensis]|uniref:DUF1573 domain-containing protein n=1 Tax=Bacteroides congonensis TaxID=1871006 RepID=UPI00189F7328|nr:DUF1573 domain-containing protein [Bacteroides congonensis]